MRATETEQSTLIKAGRMCRTVAVALIAGVARQTSFDDHEARIADMPLREQALVTGGVLAALFAVSVFAASFGLLGLALFFMAVIFLVR